MRWWCAVLVWSSVGWAQLVSPLIDDFEAPALLVPAGAWDLDQQPNGTVERTPFAAHTGDAGLRLEDTLNDPTATNATGVYRPWVAAESAVLRFWFHVLISFDTGEATIAQLNSRSGDSPCHVRLVLDGGARTLVLTGEGDTGPSADAFTEPVAEFGWTLVEARLTGLGTDAGRLEGFINGRPVGRPLPRVWRTQRVNAVALGEPFSADARFVGVVDFDNLVVSADFLPSRVELTAEMTGAPDCWLIRARLVTSDERPGVWPTPLRVTHFIRGANGSLDAACATPGTPTEWPANTQQQTYSVRVTAAESYVGLRVDGLLPQGLTLSAADAGLLDSGVVDPVLDGGSSESQPARLVVGCGCRAGQGGLALSLLAFGRLLNRRASRRFAS
jgi:hypothetical protein